jgi:hypothetical protein
MKLDNHIDPSELRVKILHLFKRYLSDILIQAGIFILSYSFFITKNQSNSFLGYSRTYINHEWGKIWGVVFVAMGVNIILRKYLANKKNG